MSRPIGLAAHRAVPDNVLPFPPMAPDLLHRVSQQLSLLPHSSADHLILMFTHLLALVVHLAGSLSEDMRLTYIGEAVTLEAKLRETQTWVEARRAFMSDLSAKQARKRRRRKKRVAGQVDLP